MANWYFYDAKRWAARHERDRRESRLSKDNPAVLDLATVRDEVRRLLAEELPEAIRAVLEDGA